MPKDTGDVCLYKDTMYRFPSRARKFLSPPSVERSLRVRLARKLLVLFPFLKLYREASVDIYSRLGIVPATTATIGEAACLRATIIRILGIEDIIDLA